MRAGLALSLLLCSIVQGLRTESEMDSLLTDHDSTLADHGTEIDLLVASRNNHETLISFATADRADIRSEMAVEITQLETDLEPSDGLLAARETASFSPKDAPNVAKAPNVENKVPNVEKVPNSARSARKRSIDTDGRVRTDQPLKSTIGGGSAAESSFKNCGPQHSSHYLTGQSAELGGGQARWPECRPQAKHIKK